MAQRKAFPLRLDPELYRALEEWAARELRSVNGQIEYLLRQAVTAHGRRLPESGAAEPESGDPSKPPGSASP